PKRTGRLKERMATVTILRPPLLVPMWSDSGPLTPPIGPAYLAASLRHAGHTARIVDGLGENPFQVTPLFDDKVMAIGPYVQLYEHLPADRHGVVKKYYDDLFAGRLGFDLIKTFKVYPSLLGVTIDDDRAELSSRMNDHPR